MNRYCGLFQRKTAAAMPYLWDFLEAHSPQGLIQIVEAGRCQLGVSHGVLDILVTEEPLD
jgi:hypothetical protein